MRTSLLELVSSRLGMNASLVLMLKQSPLFKLCSSVFAVVDSVGALDFQMF